MAFLLPVPTDGFDTYNTSQIFRKWTTQANFNGAGYAFANTAIIDPTAGRCGSGALVVGGSGPVVPGTGPSVSFAPINSGVFGFAFKIHSLAERVHLIRIQNGGVEDTFNQIAIGVNTDGTIFAVRASDHIGPDLLGGTPLAMGTSVINVDAWYYGELDYFIDPAAGTINFYVNDVLALTYTGNTDPLGSGLASSMQLGRVGASGGQPSTTITYDDFYALDKTGPAPQNARFGDVKVASRLPLAGSGSTSDWTPSIGGDPGSMVKDLTPDDDATYIYATTSGASETLKYPPLDVFTGTVFGVVVYPCARKDDAGFKQIKGLVRVGGTNFASSNAGTPSLSSYLYSALVFPTNPLTSTAWDVPTVSGMEAGVKIP